MNAVSSSSSNNINNNSNRPAHFLASTFTLLTVSWVVYLCRLYTRTWIVRQVFLEDFFITIGVAALTVFASMVPVQIAHGGGRHLVDLADPETELPQWGRAFFIAQIMYLITLWGVKLSIAFLLLRFSASKGVTWALRLTALVTTGLTLAFIFWVTFQCDPVESQWDPSINGDCASRQSYMISVYILGAVSAATDIMTAVIPVFILRNLDIDRRMKFYTAFTLALGSLACIATLVRFKYIRDFSISEDLTYTMVPLSICSFIEVSLGCICASLATLRPLLQRINMVARSSLGSEGGSQGRLHETTDGKETANRGQSVSETQPSEIGEIWPVELERTHTYSERRWTST